MARFYLTDPEDELPYKKGPQKRLSVANLQKWVRENPITVRNPTTGYFHDWRSLRRFKGTKSYSQYFRKMEAQWVECTRCGLIDLDTRISQRLCVVVEREDRRPVRKALPVDGHLYYSG